MAEPVFNRDHPLYPTWVMLLNGYGFNWYRLDELRRADDLLIRNRASEILAEAVTHLRQVEGDYRRHYLPPPTRAQPDADPLRLAEARRLHALTEDLNSLDTAIRGAAMPPDDKIWSRHRDATDMLRQLGEQDVLLIGAASEIRAAVVTVGSEAGVTDEAGAAIAARVAGLKGVLAGRASLLVVH
jgi:hypothetical protein